MNKEKMVDKVNGIVLKKYLKNYEKNELFKISVENEEIIERNFFLVEL